MYNNEAGQVPRGQERKVAGRYRLLSPLGQGGMGTVWRAQDETLHREVAVKEVRMLAGPSLAETDQLYKRLEREAWAAARIVSPNVVTVYDVASDDGRPWIVMELVRGCSLEDLLRDEGPLPPQRAAQIGADVLSALRAAHAAGVLHRDVKPANVLLSHDGRVVLTDFGIATVDGDSSLTMAGQVVGSPEYLPPERALGRTPGPESDLWSLGVLLYTAVEGAPPFQQDTALGTLRAVVEEEFPTPRRAGSLFPVITELLRKEPNERITAEHAERDLRLIAAGATLPVVRSATVKVPSVGTPAPPDAGTGVSPAQVAPVHLAAVPTQTADVASPAMGPAPVRGLSASDSPRRTKRVAVVAASTAACVLVVAGLSFAWFGQDHDGSEVNRAAASSDPAPPADSRRNAVSASSAVHVTVTGENTTYVGGCAPPAEEAPTFTATFAVDQTPAQITYRWVTDDGSVVDREWRSLTFPSGGDPTSREVVRLTAYSNSGTLASEIGVQVKGSEGTVSNKVPFSVTCEATTGASTE